MAERLGDPELLVSVLLTRRGSLFDAYTVEEHAATNAELTRLASAMRNIDLVMKIRQFLHTAHVQAGNMQAARQELEQIAALAQALRTPLARWIELALRGEHALLLGDFDDCL
jgi:hypothetical protein